MSRTRTRPAPAVGLTLGAVLGAAFLGQADGFLFTVAAPILQRDLPASFAQTQSVGAAYVLACASVLVLAGRAGDRWGHRTVFLSGMALLTAATLGCALAPGPEVLIAARAVQGLAAALVIPQELALIRALVTEEADRARALGWYGAALGSGVIGGLAGGGLLLAVDPWQTGWRGVFLATLPLCLGILLVGLRRLPRTPASAVSLDPGGAVLTALAVALLVVPLLLEGSARSAATMGWGVLGSVVTVVLLVAHQRRRHRRGMDGLYPPAVLRAPGLRPALAAVAIFFAANAGLYLVVTFHFQSGLGRGPLTTGLVLTLLGAGFILGSTLSGRMPYRIRLRIPVLGCAGVAATVACLGGVARTDPATQPLWAGLVLAFTGLAQGLVVAPLTGRILESVDVADAGAAGGLAATATQIGLVCGYAATGAVYRTVLGTEPGSPGPRGPDPHPDALGAAVALLAILVLLAGLLSLRRRATTPTDPASAGL